MDYLPDEFFINLNDRERIKYRIVRENHAEYIKIKEEISALDFEIKQKNNRLRRLKKRWLGQLKDQVLNSLWRLQKKI